MKMLKAKLYQHELEKRQEAIDANNARKENRMGSQIRNYVLHPYRMVKDMNGVEKSATDRVLDGDLIEFIVWLFTSGTEQTDSQWAGAMSALAWPGIQKGNAMISRIG